MHRLHSDKWGQVGCSGGFLSDCDMLWYFASNFLKVYRPVDIIMIKYIITWYRYLSVVNVLFRVLIWQLTFVWLFKKFLFIFALSLHLAVGRTDAVCFLCVARSVVVYQLMPKLLMVHKNLPLAKKCLNGIQVFIVDVQRLVYLFCSRLCTTLRHVPLSLPPSL